MTTIIKTKKIIIIDTGKHLELSKEAEQKISDHWKELLEVHPWLFNGPVYSTVKMENPVDARKKEDGCYEKKDSLSFCLSFSDRGTC